MRTSLFVLLIVACFGISNAIYAQSAGEITGKLMEKDSDIPIDFATIVFEGEQITKYAETDSLGNYTLKPIQAGTYTMKVHRVGYNKLEVSNILIRSNKTTRVDAEMEVLLMFDGEVPTIVDNIIFTIPLIDVENIQTGTEATDEELRVAPVSTPAEYVATTAGVIQGENGDIQMRGARAGTTAFFIEGMRVDNIDKLPMTAIKHMEVITGGIPAKYGDTTGGVVIITLK